MTVLCRDCDRVHGDTRGREWWKWRCMAAPEPREPNFVNPDQEPHPPYQKCTAINTDGECEHFAPLRVPAPKDYSEAAQS